MNSQVENQSHEIKKLHLKETIAFAIKNIPDADETTLEQLLDLVCTDGTHGAITVQGLLLKMSLILKHIPSACPHSMLTLSELLMLPSPGETPLLTTPASESMMSVPRPSRREPVRVLEVVG